MKLDREQSFCPIQTSLFIKYCVYTQKRRILFPSEKKKPHELFGIKTIVSNGRKAFAQSKDYLMEIIKHKHKKSS